MPYEQLVEQHHKLTYTTNIRLASQQMKVPMRGAVTEVTASGEAFDASDYLAPGEYTEFADRKRENIDNPAKAIRRWIARPNEWGSGEVIDKATKWDMAMDPASPRHTHHTKTTMRGVQDRILGVRRNADGTFSVSGGGVMGTAIEGKTPGGAGTDLPAGQVIPHGSAGMTLAKLMTMREMLGKADFGIDDDMGVNGGISPEEVTDLLTIAAATNAALNAYDVDQLKNGKPGRLMGVDWFITNRLPKNATGQRWCPFWSKENIILGVWQDVQGRVWNDGHARNLPVIEVSACMDAVRAEDKGVVVIEAA